MGNKEYRELLNELITFKNNVVKLYGETLDKIHDLEKHVFNEFNTIFKETSDKIAVATYILESRGRDND